MFSFIVRPATTIDSAAVACASVIVALDIVLPKKLIFPICPPDLARMFPVITVLPIRVICPVFPKLRYVSSNTRIIPFSVTKI